MTTAAPTATRAPAQAWHDRAPELAAWAWERMVVRTDVWGGYHSLADRGKEVVGRDGKKYVLGTTCTHPRKSLRGEVALTPTVLGTHFRGRRPEHVAGVHTTSPDNVCRFGTVELDVHGEGGNDPVITLAAAVGWYDELRGRGFRPLLWDSNGAGGFHLDVYFDLPVPSADLFWFLRELAAGHARYGLAAPPETFPKQPRVAPPGRKGQYGNWCRVVGRHHTRNHLATVYDGAGGWLAGAEGVAAVLATPASPATLIPADAEITGRVRAYVRKMPNRGEGQGRDDVAYNLLAFLARDLKLTDADALAWAEQWDRGNTPPKGPGRLREILANVHQYGRHDYGAGLNGSPRPGGSDGAAPPRPDAAPASGECPGLTGCQIILAHFREHYRPIFRRGNTIHCAGGRDVSAIEACSTPTSKLIDRLTTVTDAPRYKGGGLNRNALPAFFKTWARVAWGDLMVELPDEDAADLGTLEDTAETFHRLVRDAMLSEVVLGETIGKDDQTRTERRSLIDWCYRFAKPGPWRSIRSKKCWCKLVVAGDGLTKLRVAVTHGLFAQLRGDKRLTECPANTFGKRCARYGVGHTDRNDRPHGVRAVILDQAFVDELQAGIPDDPIEVPRGETEGVGPSAEFDHGPSGQEDPRWVVNTSGG